MGINTAEGGTNGVTPTSGNTGGDSGNASNTPVIATGDTVTFSSAAAKYGRLGYRMTWLAAGAGATRLSFAHASGIRSLAAFNFKINTVPTAVEDVAAWRSGGSVNIAQLGITSAGKWVARDATATAISASISTASVAANTWYRCEFACAKGTGTGDGYVGYAIFDVGGTVPLVSWESSAQNVGTADTSSFAIGRTTGRTQARTVDYDTIRWTEQASGWMGPYTPPFYVRTSGGWRGLETRKVRVSGAWV